MGIDAIFRVMSTYQKYNSTIPKVKRGPEPITHRRSQDNGPADVGTIAYVPPRTSGAKKDPTALFPDWKASGASLEEVIFAAEYLQSRFDAGAAYRATNPKTSPRNYKAHGMAMLRRPAVQALLTDYTSSWLRGRAAQLEYELFSTLHALAFYDPGQLINPDGTAAFKSWDELPVEIRRCVTAIDVKFYGKDANREAVTLTLANRADALKAIAGYLATIKNGMNAQMNDALRVSADTEMLLGSIMSGGRPVDRRSPAQRRADALQADRASEGADGVYGSPPVIRGIA